MTGPPTLEEMAAARERGRVQLGEARVEVERLKAPYLAAVGKAAKLRDALELIEAGMDDAKRRHVISRALEEAGVETTHPLTVTVTRGGRTVERYDLVAVGPEGTGLCLHTPKRSHRYQGKEFARSWRENDREQEHFRDSEGVRVVGGAEPRLVEWMQRNSRAGGFAAARRPKAPPEGGKWRWLKVREQEELTA